MASSSGRATPAHGISVSTPVCKDDFVYVSTGYGVGCAAVKVTKDGDTFKTEKLYDGKAAKAMVNHHGGFVLLGDHVYGYSDAKGWMCQELKTGKIVWEAKPKGLGKGSVTCADGHLFCYTEGDGTVALLAAAPGAFKEEGRFTIPQRSKLNKPKMAWTHPVVANGRLYLRDQEFIFCYDITEGSARR